MRHSINLSIHLISHYSFLSTHISKSKIMITFKNTIRIITAALLFSACENVEKSNTSIQSVQVETAIVNEQSITLPVHSVGKVYAKEEMKLGFKTGGIIREILVDEGETVKKGQTLAILDLSEIEARLNQSKLGFKKAQREYERAYKLYQDSVVTLEQLENAQTQLDYVRSEMEIAQFNFKYSRIVAPADGKILNRLAEENELIASGRPAFLFGSLEDSWVVRANIAETNIFKIEQNDQAKISLDAYPNLTIYGVVSEIGKSADPYTGTYEIELAIRNEDIELASGLFARFDIHPKATNKFDVIPLNALVEANEHEGFVYRVKKDQSVERKKVQIQTIRQNQLLVHSDLEQGDAVVTTGSAYINSKSVIEITNEANQLADIRY